MSRQLRRRALLIRTETYRDTRFERLPSTLADTWRLRQVLEHRQIGGFEPVGVVADLAAEDMCSEISEFLEGCGEDQLALLYVTGHGVRLSATTGEFFFIATDTDRDRIGETGVGAGFVNEQLEACPAPHKIALLDCCRSGGFATGWRTSDEPRQTPKSADDFLLNSRGVYVLASSGPFEASFSGAEGPDGPQPSVFTGEVVEALRTGKAAKDGTGNVSVDDLFTYVNRRMRVNSEQIPTTSALGVNDRIVLASCPQGTLPALKPQPQGKPCTASRTATPSGSHFL